MSRVTVGGAEFTVGGAPKQGHVTPSIVLGIFFGGTFLFLSVTNDLSKKKRELNQSVSVPLKD